MKRCPNNAGGFQMTIKRIARSCLGDVFESKDELEKLAESYHIIWKTVEVWVVGG